MSNSFINWIITKFGAWLVKNDPVTHQDYYCDFNKMCEGIQIGDVILMQGRNKIGNIIRHVTLSPWTHAALYVGRLSDIQDARSREMASPFCLDNSDKQLLVESDIGVGTILSDIKSYDGFAIRILRPQHLEKEDAQKIVNYAIGRLGMQYDVRHLLDLARFLFPWGFFPKRWRSSLFEHNALQPTKDICSSMIAECFESVDYPILPWIEEGYENKINFIRRNNRLYTPSDFDYSPYFDVIKFPFFPLEKEGDYHRFSWLENEITNDDGGNVMWLSPQIQDFFTSKAFGVVGASSDRNKFGNKVLRCYLQKNLKVYPVNPHEKMIEGIPCIDKIDKLPKNVKSISVITQPAITEQIVDEAIQKGIQNIWMQPGSESTLAIQKCKEHKINVIADGVCILRELRFKE